MVRFLDKMYCLSSSEALVKFTRNPRAYLLPPHPRIPCKVCIIGPPTSGKTSLAEMIAQHYNAMVNYDLLCIYDYYSPFLYFKVLDMGVLLEPLLADAKEAAVQEAREKAKSSTIATLTQELTQQETGVIQYTAVCFRSITKSLSFTQVSLLCLYQLMTPG